MPSSYTSNLGIELPVDGELDGVWGDVVNENMDILDRAINGVLSLSLSGTSSTLTTSDGALSNGQYKLLLLTGSPSGTHTITIAPNDADKIYFVRNTTAQSVVFTQGSGGNVTIATGDSGIIYANGAGAGAAVANLIGSTASQSANNVSISGDLTIADKIVHSGDTNTAIRFPAADTVTVETAGDERMRIDSAGNVGIGVTPSAGSLTHLEIGAAGNAITGYPADAAIYVTTNAVFASGWKYAQTGKLATRYGAEAGVHQFFSAPSGTAGNAITFTERMRIDSAGNVGIGTTSPAAPLEVKTSTADYRIQLTHISGQNQIKSLDGNQSTYRALFYDSAEHVFQTSGTERARIDSSGYLLVGKTATNGTDLGFFAGPDGLTVAVVGTGAGYAYYANRQNDDGILISLRQANAQEGTISVSGTTVSYNGGHLSRWAQFPDNSRPELLKGTVMSNLDQMSNWDGEDNEQLNCVQVSTVEGDANVAGVFVAWDTTEDDYNDILLGMTGDMVIRIGAGVTVARGDLLMSAGDGTAKPQGDDIVRSKTIAKVTSTHVSHTYEDGSYAVPCVLMAC